MRRTKQIQDYGRYGPRHGTQPSACTMGEEDYSALLVQLMANRRAALEELFNFRGKTDILFASKIAHNNGECKFGGENAFLAQSATLGY